MDRFDDCETVITPGSARLVRADLAQPPPEARFVPALNNANGAITAQWRIGLSLTMFVRFVGLLQFLRVFEMRDYSSPFWPQSH